MEMVRYIVQVPLDEDGDFYQGIECECPSDKFDWNMSDPNVAVIGVYDPDRPDEKVSECTEINDDYDVPF